MTLLELIERAEAALRDSDYDFEQAFPYMLACELLQSNVNQNEHCKR